MIALLLTISIFPLIGYAATMLFRLSQPATLSGRIALLFLIGVGINGSLLFLAGATGVPLYRPVFAVIPVAALIIVLWRGRTVPFKERARVKAMLLPNLVLAVPLIALFLAASILPIRDYDGRVTWLPKARAIVFESAVNGPFFHGQAGLNLHNHYPLLLPLDVATVMQLSGNSEIETARWLYVLIAIASLVAARDLLVQLFGVIGAWVIAIAAWLPALTALEGGVLSAYSDFTVAGFAGLAILFFMLVHNDKTAPRTAGLFLAFLVLTKTEGIVLVGVILIAAALTRAIRSPRQWLVCTMPALAALVLLAYWRARIPEAYDEQYAVLFRELPQSLHRVPAAVRAMARHALDQSEWGWFWPATAIASLAVANRHARPRMIMPLVILALMLTMYVATMTVTSWNIDELANVAARRLLSQLIIPACCVLAAAIAAAIGSLPPPSSDTPAASDAPPVSSPSAP